MALPDAILDCLVYMRDVEGFTDRDLVGLTAHRCTLDDGLLAEFLDRWRAEEAGHAAALGTYLDRYAAATGRAIPDRQAPPPAVAARWEELVGHLHGPVGRTVTAAHMTWGAANELLTLNGCRLLARRSPDPVLAQLLGRIADQEARHYAFYFLQAEWRLTRSTLARHLLPRILGNTWTPVGVGDGYKPASDYEAVRDHLAGDDAGRRTMARMDRMFATLPGFASTTLYTRTPAAA